MSRTKIILNYIKKYAKITIFVMLKTPMPSEDTKILEFNQHQKSDKTPSIFIAALESMIKTMNGCKNNPGKPSTKK